MHCIEDAFFTVEEDDSSIMHTLRIVIFLLRLQAKAMNFSFLSRMIWVSAYRSLDNMNHTEAPSCHVS